MHQNFDQNYLELSIEIIHAERVPRLMFSSLRSRAYAEFEVNSITYRTRSVSYINGRYTWKEQFLVPNPPLNNPIKITVIKKRFGLITKVVGFAEIDLNYNLSCKGQQTDPIDLKKPEGRLKGSLVVKISRPQANISSQAIGQETRLQIDDDQLTNEGKEHEAKGQNEKGQSIKVVFNTIPNDTRVTFKSFDC